MQRQKVLRVSFFVIFFGIGTAVLSLSVLSADLLGYYQNKLLLKRAEDRLERLRALNADYDVLLRQLKEDPKFAERIAPAILGTEPLDTETVYPKATAEQREAVRNILMADADLQQGDEPQMAKWVLRCSSWRGRMVLFIAGASLIVISLLCFGVVRPPNSSA